MRGPPVRHSSFIVRFAVPRDGRDIAQMQAISDCRDWRTSHVPHLRSGFSARSILPAVLLPQFPAVPAARVVAITRLDPSERSLIGKEHDALAPRAHAQISTFCGTCRACRQPRACTMYASLYVFDRTAGYSSRWTPVFSRERGGGRFRIHHRHHRLRRDRPERPHLHPHGDHRDCQ